MGDCTSRDRGNAVEEQWHCRYPLGYLITTRIWHVGGLVVDIFIEVTNPAGGKVASLDCAHDEIHTHFYGFDAYPHAEPSDIQRRVVLSLPSDPKAAAYAINSQVEQCMYLMISVAEGRRP